MELEPLHKVNVTESEIEFNYIKSIHDNPLYIENEQENYNDIDIDCNEEDPLALTEEDPLALTEEANLTLTEEAQHNNAEEHNNTNLNDGDPFYTEQTPTNHEAQYNYKLIKSEQIGDDATAITDETFQEDDIKEYKIKVKAESWPTIKTETFDVKPNIDIKHERHDYTPKSMNQSVTVIKPEIKPIIAVSISDAFLNHTSATLG